MGKSPFFNRYISYKLPFSIAMLNYQGVKKTMGNSGSKNGGTVPYNYILWGYSLRPEK